MHTLETNVFPITNLAELTTRYRLCRIVGLHKDQSEYYQNCQQLQKLSYTLKRPVIVIGRDGVPYDRILSSETGEYDADALEFADLSTEEVA